jgi:hypothetical protein
MTEEVKANTTTANTTVLADPPAIIMQSDSVPGNHDAPVISVVHEPVSEAVLKASTNTAHTIVDAPIEVVYAEAPTPKAPVPEIVEVLPEYFTKFIDTKTPASAFEKNTGEIVVVDHGKWVGYDGPVYATSANTTSLAPVVPPGTTFLKREDDDQDWYQYSRTAKNFGPASLFATVRLKDDNWIVQAVFDDRSRLWPANMRAIEIQGFNGSLDKVHKNFEGLIYNPRNLTMTPVPEVPIDLAAVAKDTRRQYEEGGLSVNGMAIATDRDSQAMITQAVVSYSLNPGLKINWKLPDGTFMPLTQDIVVQMAMITMGHVQRCFDTESQVLDNIAKDIIKTPEDVEAFFKASIPTVINTTPASA